MISKLIIHPPDKDPIQAVKDYLRTEKICTQFENNENLTWFNQDLESLKIKMVRQAIADLGYQNYHQDQPRIIVLLKADSASIPAQNSLLKVIEEPPENTQIILSATQPDQLLPTIKSRCLSLHFPQESELKGAEDIAPKTQEVKLDDLPDLLQKVSSPSQLTYSQMIDLAAAYKDREEALDLITKMVNYWYNKDTKQSTRIKLLSLLAQAYARLKMNANVKLTLEECFFQLKA